MLRHLLYNISSSVVTRGIPALVTMAAFIIVSCAKTGTIEDIKEIDAVGTDPMSFTNAGVVQSNQPTKAGTSSLQSDFVVSVWKKFGTTDRQTVMDKYKVEYKTSGTAWDGTARPYWDYTGVSGQSERFWDYAGFPYRFYAVAPYPADLTGFNLDGNLVIPADFYGQSCVDGTLAPADAEPYLVAQVRRDKDGKDYDVYANDSEIGQSGSTGLNRAVALPFHHLNCKVRFMTYATSLWMTTHHVYIKNLTVKTASANPVTAASSYKAPAAGNGSWQITDGNSGFDGLTKSATPFTLLSLTGGEGIDEFDLIERQSRQTAYKLRNADGMHQIPQEGVKMAVSFDLVYADGSLVKSFVNVPVKLEDSTDTFKWQSGYIYTYYLIINDVDKGLDIEFTATLAPWQDVSGSLSTDIEQ